MYELPKKNQMTKNEDQIQLLKLSIEELRRMHDEITNAYSNVKIKIITFIGGELALLNSLYSNGELFLPKEVYGRIFYLLGLTSCVVALLVLCLSIQPVLWRMPTESKKHRKHKIYLDFLKYVREEYVEALSINKSHLGKKQDRLDLASSLLMIGAVILLIIKNFN